MDTATLEDLLRVRSQRVELLLEYLAAVEAMAGHNALLARVGRSLNDVRVPLRVIPYEPERDRQEMAAISDDGSEARPEEPDRTRAYTVIGEWNGGSVPPRPLDEIDATAGVLVVLGDPGSGKTEWLKGRIRQTARSAIEALEQRTAEADSLPLPILARFPELARALGDEPSLQALVNRYDLLAVSPPVLRPADRLAAALLRLLLDSSPPLPEELAPWLWRRMSTGGREPGAAPIILCLDAWDEVRAKRDQLADYLGVLVERGGVKVRIASRILGYGSGRRPIPECSEWQIIPFEWAETRFFVGSFFQEVTTLSINLLDDLRRNAGTAGMARNPLLATLLCIAVQQQAAQTPLPIPTRRIELYDRILLGLLEQWRAESKVPDVEPQVVLSKQRLLEALATRFFPDEEFGVEPLHAFLRGGKGYMNTLGVDDPLRLHLLRRQWDAESELEHDGVLLRSGLGMQTRYIFLHYTIQEYLVACDLARRVEESGWDSLREHIERCAWLPEWHDVLVLLAGKLEDPEPLLQLLSDLSRDDSFRHRLALAGSCLSELRPRTSGQVEATIDEITSSAFQEWWKHLLDGTWPAVDHFRRALPGLARANGHTHAPARPGAESVSPPPPEGCPRLLDLLTNGLAETDARVVRAAARTLEEMGPVAARPGVAGGLRRLLDSSDDATAVAAVHAIGAIGTGVADDEVLRRLLEILHDGEGGTRWAAVRALGRLGRDAATAETLRSLSEMLHDDQYVRRLGATRALAALGGGAVGPLGVDALLEVLDDPQHIVERESAAALASLGSIAATPALGPALLERLTHEDRRVREAVLATIEALRAHFTEPSVAERLTPRLAALLRSDSVETRVAAARAVRALADALPAASVLDELLDGLVHPNSSVQAAAAEAIGALTPAAQDPGLHAALVALLRDARPAVRWAGAYAARGLSLRGRSPELIEALLSNTGPGDGDVRAAALDAVGAIGFTSDPATEAAVRSTLLDALRDRDSRVQSAAAGAIGALSLAIQDDGLHGALLERIRKSAPKAASRAIVALGRSATEAPHGTLELFLENAGHRDAEVRQAALAALRPFIRTAPREILGALVSALGDRDLGVADTALSTLGAFRGGSIPTEIVARLVQLLGSQGRDARWRAAQAVEALASADEPALLDALLARFTDEDPRARAAAMSTAAGAKHPHLAGRAMAGAVVLLRDPHAAVRRDAAIALRRHHQARRRCFPAISTAASGGGPAGALRVSTVDEMAHPDRRGGAV
jgi:HEAT repeat protein